MRTFIDYLNEGKEESKAIRGLLKKEYGLTSKDVGVTTKYGGYSSSVRIVIKTKKAFEKYLEIENLTSKFSKIDRDQVTGEILLGGNTYIDVEVDSKLASKIDDLIRKEIKKEAYKKENDEWLKGTDSYGITLPSFKEIYIYSDNTGFSVNGMVMFGKVRKPEDVANAVYSKIFTDSYGRKTNLKTISKKL